MSQVNCTVSNMNENTNQLTGVTANGVPYLAIPGPEDGPVVVAWHLLDPPRTEAAMAAALPLDGLDAHRIYLGLPMSGSHSLPGGPDAIFGLHPNTCHYATMTAGNAPAALREPCVCSLVFALASLGAVRRRSITARSVIVFS